MTGLLVAEQIAAASQIEAMRADREPCPEPIKCFKRTQPRARRGGDFGRRIGQEIGKPLGAAAADPAVELMG